MPQSTRTGPLPEAGLESKESILEEKRGEHQHRNCENEGKKTVGEYDRGLPGAREKKKTAEHLLTDPNEERKEKRNRRGAFLHAWGKIVQQPESVDTLKTPQKPR